MAKYITAKQLAEELLKNPDDIVCKTSSNFEKNYSIEPLTHIGLMRYKGKIVEDHFRDAFDGESYSSDVVRMDNNGDMNFVQL